MGGRPLVAAAPWHRSWLRGRRNFKIAAAAGSWCLESGRRGLRCAGLRAVASSGAAARDLTLQPPDLDVDGCTALPRRAVQGSSRPKGTVDYTVILDRLLVQFEWLIFFSQER